jgi:hypothetical protein
VREGAEEARLERLEFADGVHKNIIFKYCYSSN